MLVSFPDKERQTRLKEALVRLRRDNGFRLVAEWIELNLKDTDKQLRWQGDDVQVRQCQGRSQVLAELAGDFDENF